MALAAAIHLFSFVFVFFVFAAAVAANSAVCESGLSVFLQNRSTVNGCCVEDVF